MKPFADVISLVINPLVLPPILLALVAAHVGAPPSEVRTVAILGTVLFFLLPLGWLYLMVRMGTAATLDVRNRAVRQGPLAVGLALMLFAATAYWFMAPVSRDPVVGLTLSLALNTFLVMKITGYVKISIHVAGVAGFAAMLGTLSALDPAFGQGLPGPGMWPFWLAVPIVMWARVKAEAHVRAEVVLGLLFGLVIPPLEVLALHALGLL
ncbi:MAG: hypothetical protein RIE53_04545 [Rhodothermales bacterium]